MTQIVSANGMLLNDDSCVCLTSTLYCRMFKAQFRAPDSTQLNSTSSENVQNVADWQKTIDFQFFS